MKITFVIKEAGMTGGYRAIYECANQLMDKGHDVRILCPLMPLRIAGAGIRSTAYHFYTQLRALLKYLVKGLWFDWFKVRPEILKILTLSPRFITLFENTIPDSDFIVASAWETVYPVHKLSARKGKKIYFVQHYEAWDLWGDRKAWENAGSIKDLNILTLTMANQPPVDAVKQQTRQLIDDTYRLPLYKITTSSWLKNLMEKKFGQTAESVTLGVNIDDFYYEKYPRDGRTVLMPYRRSGWKGEEDGIAALTLVKKARPSVRILVYGTKRSTNLPAWLESRNAKVVFGDELRKLYCSADVFVFPSWIEGWGLPPMEAMACKTACVVTSTGAVPEYIIPGETATVVPPRDPKSLADAIITLLTDNEKRHRIADSGYRHIHKFSWKTTAEQFERILEKQLR